MSLRTLTSGYALASLTFTAVGAFFGGRGDLGSAVVCAVVAAGYALLALAAARSTRP